MSEPLYARIAREIAQEIHVRRLPAGSPLPSEGELCQRHSVSRHTVRAALRELSDLGLVASRKGVGSFVTEPRRSPGFDQSLASIDDLAQLAESNLREVKATGEVVADRALARELGCAPGTRWFHLASIRRASDAKDPPICWTDNYVDPAYAGIRKLVRKDPSALVSDLIEKQYGRRAAEVRQLITAIGVPKSIADELRVEPGSPALKIVRHYMDRAGVVFETTISIHPENRFQFSMVLRRALPE